jgi:hypothetical protein
MSIESQYEREERDIQEQHACGEISAEECNRLLRELWRDYHAAAQESAQEAYDNEMERW